MIGVRFIVGRPQVNLLRRHAVIRVDRIGRKMRYTEIGRHWTRLAAERAAHALNVQNGSAW